MKTGCFFCLENHAPESCAKIEQLKTVRDFGITDPMHDEPDMAVVDRLHRLRAYTRGLLTDMRRAGLNPSPETVALTPPLDSFET
jgi:hypothetical protein